MCFVFRIDVHPLVSARCRFGLLPIGASSAQCSVRRIPHIDGALGSHSNFNFPIIMQLHVVVRKMCGHFGFGFVGAGFSAQ